MASASAAASPQSSASIVHSSFRTPLYAVEAISCTTVKLLDKARFNTNNHHGASGPPSDYAHVLSGGRTHHWIDQFKRRYSVINIDAREMRWMRKAELIGSTTARFSHKFADERDALCASHRADTEALFPPGCKHFVRTENVSLKYGCHGAGPYTSLSQIVESLVTSTNGHSPLSDRWTANGEEDESLHPIKLYLIPWVEMSKHREFRVFVCNDRITAVSQQNLYAANAFLAGLPSDAVRQSTIVGWLDSIVKYHAEYVRPRIRHISSYSMDLVILEDGQCMFIEPNCFGAEYAAGSSLFHWIEDRAHLYGESRSPEGQPQIVFRYTLDTESEQGQAATDSDLDAALAASLSLSESREQV